MSENVKKLTLLGLGITVMSFLILSNARAQTPGAASSQTIKSSHDYQYVEKSIDGLASELYNVNQLYPDFRYIHHYDKTGKLKGVTVMGLDDSSLAVKTAFCIMKLEVLGNLMRNVDEKYIPDSPTDGEVKSTYPTNDRENFPTKDSEKSTEQIIYPQSINLL